MASLNWLRKGFPFIAAIAGATGGPLIGSLANMAGKALGVDVTPETLPKVLAEAAMSEEGRLKLAELETNAKAAADQLGFKTAVELAQIDAADRDSARKRETDMAKTGLRDWAVPILAGFITAGFFLMLWIVMIHGCKPGTETLCNVMLGALCTAWLAVVMYYFGSSAGSARKTELLSQAPAIAEG